MTEKPDSHMSLDLTLCRHHVEVARQAILDGTNRSEGCAHSKYADLAINLGMLVEVLCEEVERLASQLACSHESMKESGWGTANWCCADCGYHGRVEDLGFAGGRPAKHE